MLKPVERRSSPPAFEIENTDISEDISSVPGTESVKSRKRKVTAIDEEEGWVSSSRKFNQKKKGSEKKEEKSLQRKSSERI